ncbi:MAG: hypothetical protein V4613_08960 [Bacteroidota bacterium]
MRKYLLIALITGITTQANAQFFGNKSVGVYQGLILFNEPILNNRNNSNNKTSWITEIDKTRSINESRYFSINYGLGIGNYKNPDNRFETYQSSTFYRAKFALMMHLPYAGGACSHCSHINLFTPFLSVGYNLDLLNNTFKAVGNNRVNANLRIGGGGVVKLGQYFGLMYGLTLNQRINVDYRTFFQHNFGVIVNLDLPESVIW